MTARPAPGPRIEPRTVPLAPRAYTSLPDWQRREVDTWVATTVVELGWPTDLETAGVDVRMPTYPNWHPDNCNHPVAVAARADAGELTLPCTLPDRHGGAKHQVWTTAGELIAEAPAAVSVPVPRPRKVEKIKVEREPVRGDMGAGREKVS